ncbi:hypothetical protein [uncultured Draconibacterium sp.]|uniref:hypothetical protein n=1 Tax=uncultured Draconibacterium sp. TaxID=1573823 RepID=UPI0032162137
MKQKLNTFTKHIILIILVFGGLNVIGQELSNPKKIKAKGEYIQKQTEFIFPENFDSYQRQDIYSFDKKKTNIGVVYGNQQNQTTISIYVYPAGDGYEGRLRNEYQNSMQSIANFSSNGISTTKTTLVRHQGEKYICNGIQTKIKQNDFNSLTIYECGEWFLKVRISTNELDSIQISSLEQKIYNHFDPTNLTALNPLNSMADVYFSKVAFQDSTLLGSAMGSAYKKIDWALENVKENERASGFPDLYLNLQVESLKAFMEFQHRFSFQKTQFTKQYLNELQLISDAGFLAEFVMEQFNMLLIFPQNFHARYVEYQKWRENKITIDLNQEFYVVSYGEK